MDDGSRTWRPPSRLKRTVTEPKSVCSPRAMVLGEGDWGGAFKSRIWSPLWEPRAWSAGRPPRREGTRGSRVERRARRCVQMAWDERM
jgi:hypothetical protein